MQGKREARKDGAIEALEHAKKGVRLIVENKTTDEVLQDELIPVSETKFWRELKKQMAWATNAVVMDLKKHGHVLLNVAQDERWYVRVEVYK